ncbi:MAG: RimK family alpha-L-glutamate ligase [Myxococcaceae bacterium]
MSSSRPRSRIAVLSRKRSLYSTARLVEAIKKRGHHPTVLDTLKCTMLLGPDGPKMHYRGAEVSDLLVAIPRIGASVTGYGVKVANHFIAMGIPVLNDPPSITRSRDKLRALQLLAAAGIGVPPTVMAHDGSHVQRLVEQVGGLPAIVKLLRGTQGVGVMLATTLDEVKGIVGTFYELGQEILIQQFISEARGRDVRALVVGDRVVGAMRRKARKGEFRANIHRGGEGKPIRLSEEFSQVAVRAAQVVGLEVAGVDMLEGKDGPLVMELNSSPGFEGLERATGKDIAGAIIDHGIRYAASFRAARRGRPEL